MDISNSYLYNNMKICHGIIIHSLWSVLVYIGYTSIINDISELIQNGIDNINVFGDCV